MKVAGVIFDFDGVFTDNSVYTLQDGQEFVKCSRLDGIGLSMLRDRKIPSVVISSEKNPVVLKRCEKLKIEAHNGILDKVAAATTWAEREHVELTNCCFLGNDINDLPLLNAVGYPYIVNDAVERLIENKKFRRLKSCGGAGAVRELCEILTKGDLT